MSTQNLLQTDMPEACSQCGGASFSEAEVRSAFWLDDRLVVVEDIPAMVCDACGDRHYADETVAVLDLMHGDGFPEEQARRRITVPVHSFQDALKRGC